MKKRDAGVATYYVRSSVLGGAVVAELTGAGAWQRGYVYGGGGEVIAIRTPEGMRWVHQDPATKTQRLTDSSGAITAAVDLDPWGGETARSWNSQQQPRKYTTYERDSNADDEAMMRRYSRRHGRFSQPDPYDGSYDLTDPQSLNRYSYVSNDPVNFTDPSGLDDEFVCQVGDTQCLLGSVTVYGGGGFGGIGGLGGGGVGGAADLIPVYEVGTGTEGGGGGFFIGPQSSAEADRLDKKPFPSCHEFVDYLVKKVFDARWYVSRGDVGNGMMLRAKDNPYGKAFPGGPTDSNGFRDALTQYGQQGDVYRHILFFAGSVLNGTKPVRWLAERTDRKQAQAGRRESLSELEGDQSGKRVGKLMDQGFNRDYDRAGLRDALRAELCK